MLGAMRVESIFISDVHLGQSGCRATELLAFLAKTEAKNIFVIGDPRDRGRSLLQRWRLGRELQLARRNAERKPRAPLLVRRSRASGRSAIVAAAWQLESVRQ